MSYIGEVRRSAFESFGTAVTHVAVSVAVRGMRIVKAIARRRVIAHLGEFDDRMLRDIGLNRSDLRDAASGPIWRDPTSVLVVRAVEKRAARRPVRARVEAPVPASGALATLGAEEQAAVTLAPCAEGQGSAQACG
ncbi:DUF1127 domain-containing protein [Ancylobacter sp. 6x-1]|uniref:DUF1127 domain-containing protein n=1 Tax=Ancylobacter crimeensis TaxID=2579147 RepID=A0ABT0DAR2_9HYPH|nr:DUF1127 domain-containing protein [Ancylobacter crimeensis]MCK0197032.1 DUF1127 domain-containing protein [Ancylobacter crimeensis]